MGILLRRPDTAQLDNSEPRGLDVELLAAAICNREAALYESDLTYDRFDEVGKAVFRAEARPLAAEYDRLARGDAA